METNELPEDVKREEPEGVCLSSKCKICYDLADEYFGAGKKPDSHILFEDALCFAHFVAESLNKKSNGN